MSSFKVPLPSSPPTPSTPNAEPRHSPNYGSSSFLGPIPSTTPAGPPPSSVGSFTPADPPPSSIFGSSQLGPGRTLFKSKGTSRSTPRSRRGDTLSSKSEKLAKHIDHSSRFEISSLYGDPSRTTFGLSDNTPAKRISQANGREGDEDEVEGAFQDESQKLLEGISQTMQSSILDSSDNWCGMKTGSGPSPKTSGYTGRNNMSFPDSSLLASFPQSVKRSRGDIRMSHSSPRSAKKPARPKKESAMPSIAKAMAAQMGIAGLAEPDNLILETEDLVATLYAVESEGGRHQHSMRAALHTICENICNLWVLCRDSDIASSPTRGEIIVGIGPSDEAPPLHKAIFVSTLLLRLHHPPTARGKQALALTRLGNSFTSSRPPVGNEMPHNPTAIPKVLIDWIDVHHNPWESTFQEVEMKHPSPPAHYNFWDVVFVLILRGKLRDAVRMLRMSDFACAGTARKDGQSNGYTDLQVKSIKRVVNKAIQVLESCPALKDEDWHVTGSDWVLFRKRAGNAIYELAMFAEGHDQDTDPAVSTTETPDLALQSSKLSHSQVSRRAGSRVPWSVYQSLKVIYGILLGGKAEIISSAQDWVEASIGLTVWWTGEDTDNVSVGSPAITKRFLRHTQSRGQRMIDIDREAAYLDRLSCSFQRATAETDEDEFQINSNNPVEVGLASVFEGNVEGVLNLLLGWSLPVADAVAEIATLGGWFNSSNSNPTGLMKEFDESDLIVLRSYGHSDHQIRRDTIMIEYAEALFERGQLCKEDSKAACEGWELSLALLVRLGDDRVSRREIGKILTRLPIDSDARVDMILRLCGDYGLEEEARAITEKYADNVAETSNNYGTALIYYARAHSSKKIKDVLDLLISLSLAQSAAFPPLSLLDPNLYSLLFNPEQAFAQLAILDREAAKTLHKYLAGYATLRKFYDLRDEEINLEQGQKPALLPVARKRAATVALLAVISSAAESLSGGLYDESRGAVVQVDGLLALLGEAMMFVDRPTGLLSLPQCTSLLKAIEDLETVTGRVYNQCERCFHATLTAFHGNALPASPRQLLKTMSSMTSASSFSLVSSSMVDSLSSNGMESNGALVNSQQQEKRGWDWRAGTTSDMKGEDVLRILRLGLARDVARHWMDDDH